MRTGEPRISTDGANAFTVLELLIVTAIATVLLAILAPAIEHVRHQAYIDKCASNLRQIGLAVSIYEIENHGAWPRTVYDPATADRPTKGTGATAPDPFTADTTVAANDLTAGIFLLLRSEHLPASVFICPYNDATEYKVDPINPAGRSNFTNQRQNLGYSFADPYPSALAGVSGYALNSHLSAACPVGADKNPGLGEGTDNVYAASVNGASSKIQSANSLNHEQEGQNVLFADGHVSYERTPFVGIGHDNIYTAKSGQPPLVEQSPDDKTDTLLLPTDD